MNTGFEPSELEGRRKPSRHVWVPVSAVGLVVGLFVFLMLPVAAQLEREVVLAITKTAGAVATIMLLGWYLFLSGFSALVRFGGITLVGLLVVAVFASVRRVEFNGAMQPTLVFRWSPDPAAVLEAHRKSQQSADTPQSGDSSLVISASPHDVFEFRGSQRNGVSDEVKLARDWESRPPKLVWRQPIGGGYAAFVVAGPLAITIEQRRDQEAIVAYDFDTGKERWKYEYPALFSETLGGDGPRATPTIHEDMVYSLGATGMLVCLELTTGQKIWDVDILKKNGASNLEWGMSGSPLIQDGEVIVNPGSQKGNADSWSLLAFDHLTGKQRWGAGHSKAGYASPVVENVAGRRQFVLFDGVGLIGFDATEHDELWQFPWPSQFDINATQPVPVGADRWFITSAAGGALIQVTCKDGRFAAEQVWKNNKMKCYFGTPIFYAGHLFGIDDNLMACVDASTGKQRWKARAGDYGHGELLRSGDLLIVLSETGQLALVAANPDKFTELARIQAIEGRTWNYPTLAGNRILVRNHLEMAAYDLPTE